MLFAYLILVVPFGIALLIAVVMRKPGCAHFGGILGLSLCFVAFGILHFTATDIVVQMLPTWVPYRVELVYLTGVIEIALGIALLVPKCRVIAGWFCIASLLAFFPANIYTWLADVPVPGHDNLVEFIVVRMNYQLLMIFWAWWFAVRRKNYSV